MKFGKLIVKCIGAIDLASTSFVGKSDPYCRITGGDQVQQTKVHEGGG